MLTSRGQLQTVSSLLDLAGAALAWALQLEQPDAAAAFPLMPADQPRGADPVREGGLRGSDIAAAQRRVIAQVRGGDLRAVDLVAGRAIARDRRDGATVPWGQLVAADPAHGVSRVVSIARGRIIDHQIALGELVAGERSAIVEDLEAA